MKIARILKIMKVTRIISLTALCALPVWLFTAVVRAQGNSSIHFDAVLVDKDRKAKIAAAAVQVDVMGLELVDPDQTRDVPHSGQGHIHYRLDEGPVIATTSTKISFHELSRGKHSITVWLAGNDHQPLGPQKNLTFSIP